jgi:hypothetical protein
LKEKFTIKAKDPALNLKGIIKADRQSFKDKSINKKMSMINKRRRIKILRKSLRKNNRNKRKAKSL